MRLWCFECGKSVSNELPSDTTFRATAMCPECIEKEPDKDNKIKELEAALAAERVRADHATKLALELEGHLGRVGEKLAAERELLKKCIPHCESAWEYYDEYGSRKDRDEVGKLLDKLRGE